MIKKVCRY
jgi:hypothetical protein